MTCRFCHDGTAHDLTVRESFDYKGATLVVTDYEITRCDACGEETVTREQSRRNLKKLADAKRRHDGLLVSAELIRVREILGNVSQETASRLFTATPGAWYKYESGEVLQSVGLDRLIRMVMNHPALASELADLEGMPFACPNHDHRGKSVTGRSTTEVFTVVMSAGTHTEAEVRLRSLASRFGGSSERHVTMIQPVRVTTHSTKLQSELELPQGIRAS